MHNKAEYDYSPVTQANDDDDDEEENFWAKVYFRRERIYGIVGR